MSEEAINCEVKKAFEAVRGCPIDVTPKPRMKPLIDPRAKACGDGDGGSRFARSADDSFSTSGASTSKSSGGEAAGASALAAGSSVAGVGGASIFPSGYGFVVLTAVGSIVMVTWQALKVGIARDEYKIPYPQMYTTDNVAFNCVVRAHQNTMESYPQFLLLLMIGGYEMPYFCTLGGWTWIVGRIMYANGYYTGDPSKRAKGTVSFVGMLMLLAATSKFALKHLRG